jgi:hypothetical protein
MAKLNAITIDGQRFDLTAKADLVNGKIPESQLPSYVDDVVEAADLAAFPATGETGKIYLAIDTGKIYRWSGSTFVNIPTTPEPLKVATWSDTTQPKTLSDMTDFDIVYIEIFEDFSYWVPFTLLIKDSEYKNIILPYYYTYDGLALYVEITFDKSTKTFAFFGYSTNNPVSAKIYYR